MSITQGVTSSVNRVQVIVDTRVMDTSIAVGVATVGLTASAVTNDGATLTLSGHTGGWWYQGGKVSGALGTGTSVPSGNSATLSGLDSLSAYEYQAYSKANCQAVDLIATERFKTLPSGSNAAFSATNVAWNTARPTLVNHTGDWWYKGGYRSIGEGPCTAGPSNFVLDLAGLSGNTGYTYTAFSDSSCGTQVASIIFRTQVGAALTVSNITANTATITLANYAFAWWYDGGPRRDGPGECRVGAADYSVDLTGLPARTPHIYGAYSDSDCTTSNQLDTVSFGTTNSG